MIADQTRGQQLAQAAAAFIGVRFQLLGRDPKQGLDCVGLITCSLQAIECQPVAPCGYRLRNSDPEPWINCAERSGLAPVNSPVEAGDVILLKPGPGQHHLVIAESARVAIHAHAGFRRVVRQPMSFSESRHAQWRLI